MALNKGGTDERASDVHVVAADYFPSSRGFPEARSNQLPASAVVVEMSPSSKRAPSEGEEEWLLPRPSLALKVAALCSAGIALATMTMVMSDVGHAVGCALGALVSLTGASYMAWQSRRH